MNLKKIVVIGPESTGKSTLCKLLAEHFNTDWVPEFAREYLLKNGVNYKKEDLLKIAKGQIEAEDKLLQKISSNSNHSCPIFIDTDLYVMKVWSEFVFNSCDSYMLNGIAKRKYDLYLLCRPDLPWVEDELREYPDQQTRIKLYHYYREALINQSCPWVEIEGGYESRIKQAIAAVEKLF